MSAPVDALCAGADFMHFAASESAALQPTDWEVWAERVERVLGHDLDGEDSDAARQAGTSDGYSLDGAYEAWRSGDSVMQHVADVRAAIAAIARVQGGAA